MRIAHAPSQLERRPRAVAIGTFDGVHRGHRSVLQATIDSGLDPTVITFDPHPRVVLGNRVELITTLERRLELLADAGVADTLVVAFTPGVHAPVARGVHRDLPDGDRRRVAVAAGDDFRFGHKRAGSIETLAAAGLEPLVVDGRRRRLVDGDPRRRARGRRRPRGDDARPALRARRHRRRGRPARRHARVPDREPRDRPAARSTPRYGIYAGSALGHRAAVSIGTNPHYGGTERRIEPFLLDFDGDLYGKRLVVELWERLRDERVFESEEALIEQIGRDVEATPTRCRAPRLSLRVRRATNTVCDMSSSSGSPRSTAGRSRPRRGGRARCARGTGPRRGGRARRDSALQDGPCNSLLQARHEGRPAADHQVKWP